MEDRRYNLRLQGRKVQIPVQIHVSGENMVDTQTLGGCHLQSGQLFTQQSSVSSSESDLDISSLLDMSDRELFYTQRAK